MKRQRGFTLLETMVAVIILGTAIAAVSGVISTSLRNVARAEDYQRVTLLARSQMNELLTLPWHNGQTWSGNWADGYRWTAVVDVVPPDQGRENGSYDLLRMSLVGTWKTTRGVKTYTLETARLQRKQ